MKFRYRLSTTRNLMKHTSSTAGFREIGAGRQWCRSRDRERPDWRALLESDCATFRTQFMPPTSTGPSDSADEIDDVEAIEASSLSVGTVVSEFLSGDTPVVPLEFEPVEV